MTNAKRYIISLPTELRLPLSYGNTAPAVYDNKHRRNAVRKSSHANFLLNHDTHHDMSVCGGGVGISLLARAYK
jgi:hypothetical protein